jgi:hypothetical protein
MENNFMYIFIIWFSVWMKFVYYIVSAGNSWLSRVMEGRKVSDYPKQRLKQKQSKHSTKWIYCKLFLVKNMSNIKEQTYNSTDAIQKCRNMVPW